MERGIATLAHQSCLITILFSSRRRHTPNGANVPVLWKQFRLGHTFLLGKRKRSLSLKENVTTMKMVRRTDKDAGITQGIGTEVFECPKT